MLMQIVQNEMGLSSHPQIHMETSDSYKVIFHMQRLSTSFYTTYTGPCVYILFKLSMNLLYRCEEVLKPFNLLFLIKCISTEGQALLSQSLSSRQYTLKTLTTAVP